MVKNEHSCSHPPTRDPDQCAERSHGPFGTKACHYCGSFPDDSSRVYYDRRSLEKLKGFMQHGGHKDGGMIYRYLNRCVAHGDHCKIPTEGEKELIRAAFSKYKRYKEYELGLRTRTIVPKN